MTKGLARVQSTSQSTIENYGLTEWQDGNITINNGAKFENHPGAWFDVQTDSIMEAPSGQSLFQNWGNFEKTQGFGDTRIRVSFNNQTKAGQALAQQG